MTIKNRHRTALVVDDGIPTKTIGQQDAEFRKIMKQFSAGEISLGEAAKRNPYASSRPKKFSLRQLLRKLNL